MWRLYQTLPLSPNTCWSSCWSRNPEGEIFKLVWLIRSRKAHFFVHVSEFVESVKAFSLRSKCTCLETQARTIAPTKTFFSVSLQTNYLIAQTSFLPHPFPCSICTLKVRPHRKRSAAADCGLCPLRNVTF